MDQNQMLIRVGGGGECFVVFWGHFWGLLIWGTGLDLDWSTAKQAYELVCHV